MNARYQPTTRKARALAAVAAFATVVALFEFVAGLGETNAMSAAQSAAVPAQTVWAEGPISDAASATR